MTELEKPPFLFVSHGDFPKRAPKRCACPLCRPCHAFFRPRYLRGNEDATIIAMDIMRGFGTAPVGTIAQAHRMAAYECNDFKGIFGALPLGA